MPSSYYGPQCQGQCETHPACSCDWLSQAGGTKVNALADYILASTSRYRASLLGRLKRPFISDAPVCDETPLPDEQPQALASRLAKTKARSLADRFPESLIIGSDQVASLNGIILGKPGTKARAQQQLQQMQNQTLEFFTALCVLETSTGQHQQFVDTTRVRLRSLSDDAIERYIDSDMPLDCAGSFKVESLGISLFESVESNDPTALIGLPLIRLSQCLREFGVAIP